MKPKIVICASGEGTNFEALVKAARQNELQAEVTGLISNRDGIGALTRAQNLNVPHSIIRKRDYSTAEQWDQAFKAKLQEYQADWVILAGFLSLVGPEVLRAFPKRIVNTHPSLLPQFGGHGMYGHHVHSAVLESGAKVTGVTVHLVDEIYDRGEILAQLMVPVEANDTLTTLATRVKNAETDFFTKILNELVTGRINPR